MSRRVVRRAPPWGEAGTLPVDVVPDRWGSKFRRALSVVAPSEGGDSDHPSDPGGRTRWGITQRTFRAWLRREGHALRGVETMDALTAAAIYRDRYWLAGYCELLDISSATAHFDAMVQHGPGSTGAVGAIHLLQRALGVPDDGIVGPVTRFAAQDLEHGLVEHLLFERLMHYWRILDNRPDLRVFSRGWRNRMEHLRTEALKLRPTAVVLPPLQPVHWIRARRDDNRIHPAPRDARRRAA